MIANPPTRVCARSARVVERVAICREHVRLELRVPEFPQSQPGQFLQLLCHPPDEPDARFADWADGRFPQLSAAWLEATAYLRRPFSIADRVDRADGAHLEVISRAIGPGTRWLDKLATGDALDLTGPLGQGFRLPAAECPVLLIGGGVGIPPLLYLTRTLHDRGFRDVTAVFGALSGDLLAVSCCAQPSPHGVATRCLELPGDAPFAAIVTTDDGTLGLPGRVTEGLDAWVRQRVGDSARRALVYACGPERMLRAIAEQTRALGIACQLCIERTMGCGLGTCLSCVVRVHDSTRATGWRWALSCSEGPVFDRDQLVD